MKQISYTPNYSYDSERRSHEYAVFGYFGSRRPGNGKALNGDEYFEIMAFWATFRGLLGSRQASEIW